VSRHLNRKISNSAAGLWRAFEKYAMYDSQASVMMLKIRLILQVVQKSLIKSRRMRWAGNLARRADRRVAYRVSVGRPEGKRPLGRPRCRCEDNIKIFIQEVRCEA